MAIPASSLVLLVCGCVDAEPQAAPPVARAADQRSVETYDIRDLALPSALRRLIEPRGSAEGAPREDGALRAASPGESALANFLRDHTAPKGDAHDSVTSDFAAWKLMETLVECVAARSGTATNCETKESGALVVTSDAATQKTIGAVVAGVRRADDALPIAVRVLELDRRGQGILKEFALAHGTDGAPASTLVMDPTQEELALLLASNGTTVVGAPSVVAAQLDAFEVEVAEHLPYVASFEIKSIEGVGTITDPLVKTAKSGVTVRGRCVAAVGLPGNRPPPFALRLEVEIAALKRPLAEVKSDLGTIQLPELKRATLSTTLAGTAGRALLIGGVQKPGFDDADAKKKIFVLVTVGLPTHGG